ncbi:unnamed protein product [Didymodactylos carnosus]|uniref:Reverse transcriptase domain-containing protein n=1 Tax=Didymodactylos carnosus TaxID=1234261 RepID=A0A8S2TGJ6_9BILA|nr:unnamed protein product [Didymodactylos carnosus]CAF4286519.1 unnamed protein product [Didymodactylos carnosus]
MENDKVVRAVLIDFQKAFDQVSHEGLVFKLTKKGVKGKALNWIADYLHDRTIQAMIDGVTSAPRGISKGVPQGSILGPSLFLIYIDDLPIGIESAIRLFADDTLRFSHDSDLVLASQRLARDLIRVIEWAKNASRTVEVNIQKPE